MSIKWANSRRIARVSKKVSRHHQRPMFHCTPSKLDVQGAKNVHSLEGKEWLISHHATSQKR